MATIAHWPGTSFDGLTTVEIDGTVTIDSSTFLMANKVGSGSNTCGLYTTESPITVAVNNTIYAQVSPIGGTNVEGGLQIKTLAQINDPGTNGYNAFQFGSNRDQARLYYSDTIGGTVTNESQGNDTIPSDFWSDIAIKWVDSDGRVEFWYRLTPGGVPGNFSPDSGPWTVVDGDRFSFSANVIGEPIFLALQYLTDGNGTGVRWADIYVTDNGEIGPPTPPVDDSDGGAEMLVLGHL